jgi:hypothetical protein
MKRVMKPFKALLASALLVLQVQVASAAPAQPMFKDVPPTHWAYEAVMTLARKGIIEGYPGGTFNAPPKEKEPEASAPERDGREQASEQAALPKP